MKTNYHKQKGVVILFAMLTIGLLIGLGISISGLTQKQLILTSLGKQSQVAFYAADTGAECARYWDLVKDAFGTIGTISCGNQNITVIKQDNSYNFEIDIYSSVDPKYNYCASVLITKNETTDSTIIDSRGYNLPCGASNSSRKVERAVVLTY